MLMVLMYLLADTRKTCVARSQAVMFYVISPENTFHVFFSLTQAHVHQLALNQSDIWIHCAGTCVAKSGEDQLTNHQPFSTCSSSESTRKFTLTVTDFLYFDFCQLSTEFRNAILGTEAWSNLYLNNFPKTAKKENTEHKIQRSETFVQKYVILPAKT